MVLQRQDFFDYSQIDKYDTKVKFSTWCTNLEHILSSTFVLLSPQNNINLE